MELTDDTSMKTIGTRMEVAMGLAKKTSGGITKDGLVIQGSCVRSKKAVDAAKERYGKSKHPLKPKGKKPKKKAVNKSTQKSQ